MTRSDSSHAKVIGVIVQYKLIVRFLQAGLLLALTSTALASTTWYANGVTGSDGNNCTAPTTACKTIGHAISIASSGDSIKVAAATYNENLTVGISLTVIGSGAPTTIVDGGGVGTVITISSGVQVTLSSLTIRNGHALNEGGGISNQGVLTINKSTISGNSATSQSCTAFVCGEEGGGIFNLGKLTINNSTVAGNTVWITCSYGHGCFAAGGGIYNAGTLNVRSSTITANSATSLSGYGGGIYNSFGTVTVSSSTISENNVVQLGSSGGIYNYRGPVTLQNSILANNSLGNCYGVTSNGYNLSSDSTCNFNNTGDLNNTDPLLGPLQNNGGPTQTQALLAGSPAIDGGNPSGCTDNKGNLLKTDQRGAPRPDKEDAGGCDMGAYERQTD